MTILSRLPVQVYNHLNNLTTTTQPQQPPVTGYPITPSPYHPQPQPWGETKAIGAPLGFSPYFNGNWGWGGGPPGAA